MRCLSRMLTLVSSGLILSSCASRPLPPVDSFCTVYNPVITEKGDGAAVAAIKKEGPKRKTLANELNYRSQCGVTPTPERKPEAGVPTS